MVSEDKGLVKVSAGGLQIGKRLGTIRGILTRRRDELESELGDVVDAQEAFDSIVAEFMDILDNLYKASEASSDINNQVRHFIREHRKDLTQGIG